MNKLNESKLTVLALVLFATMLLTGCNTVSQSTTTGSSSGATTAFNDDLSSYNTSLFDKSDGYSNEGEFNVGWKSSHAYIDNGKLVLKLDNESSWGKPYSSGEYKTDAVYGYGTLEASIKAASGDGIVGGSLFFYTGTSGTSTHHEIDIEFLGKDTTKMQTNYFTNGVGSHEVLIDLGFDASQAYHTYAIEWQSDRIAWFVDGILVHTENGSNGALPTTPGKIYVNLWPGTGVDSWLNPFTYSAPIYVYYDYIKFTPFN